MGLSKLEVTSQQKYLQAHWEPRGKLVPISRAFFFDEPLAMIGQYFCGQVHESRQNRASSRGYERIPGAEAPKIFAMHDLVLDTMHR